MGYFVRAPLHCLAAQPNEAAIFEGELFPAVYLQDGQHRFTPETSFLGVN
jgi:hypothetical protein